VSGEGFYLVAGSIRVPFSQDLGAIGTPCLALSVLSVGDVPRDIPCVLSARDIPLVGPNRPLARGYALKDYLTNTLVKHLYVS
jgi:hypothetical protein